MTVFYDQEMDGKRPKGWGDSGAAATEGSLPVQTKASFAHLREYESYVTAAHLKDEKAVSQKVRSAFSRPWPAHLTPVSYVVPDADTGLVWHFSLLLSPSRRVRDAYLSRAWEMLCVYSSQRRPTRNLESKEIISAGLGQWFSHEFSSLDFEVCIWLGIVELALCNIETGRRDEICCQVKCFCHSIEPSSSNGILSVIIVPLESFNLHQKAPF
jgi:hypothetical protein